MLVEPFDGDSPFEIDTDPPPTEAYLRALDEAWPTEPAAITRLRKMLAAQIAEYGTINSFEMDRQLGWKKGGANIHYGKFGGEIGLVLGIDMTKLDGKYRVISSGMHYEGIPGFFWRFHHTFEAALRRFPPTQDLFEVSDFPSLAPEPVTVETSSFPNLNEDSRERIEAQIVARQGQPAFRQSLLDAYAGCCAITGCQIEKVLDAAHIRPYRGPQCNARENGLLLRTDLHTLLDCGLKAINPKTMRVVTAPSLRRAGSGYEDLHGCFVSLPKPGCPEPSYEALRLGYEEFRKRYPR